LWRAILGAMWPTLTDDAVVMGEEVATFADLLLVGIATGLYDEAVLSMRRGLEAVAHSDVVVTREAVLKEAVAFRRARTLESGQDLRAWLEGRHLSMAEWEEHLTRSVAAREVRIPAAADTETAVHSDQLGSPLDFEAVMIELACGGWWQQFADDAARLWAAGRMVGNDIGGAGGDVAGETTRIMAAHTELADLGRAWCTERLETIRTRERALEEATRRCATTEAVAARVLEHGTEWSELCFDELLLANREAANEALLCAREDGIDATGLATRAGVALQHRRARHDSLPLASATLLDGALPGEPFGPVALGDGWAVLWLRERLRPSPEDDSIRSAAADELLSDALDKAGLGLIRESSVL
jgi:hypothetical protein